MIQKLSIVLFFIGFVYKINAQNIQGKIVDHENSIGLATVVLTNIEDKSTYTTLPNGTFNVPKKGEYLIEKVGYITKKINLNSTSFKVIILELAATTLQEIEITGNNFQNKLTQIPASIGLISAKNFEENTINLSQLINKTPGVYMQSGTLTTNKITIRGIGSRNLFGTSKIKMYYEDIPLTNGSGESAIEDIEIAALGRIEIVKGAASSIFGSGLGGTILLIPHKGNFSNNTLKSSLTVGSFGLHKYSVQTMLGNETNSANIVYSNTSKDGYRENNRTTKEVITLASNHFINNKNKLTFIANYVDFLGFIPSSINQTDYLNSPTSAAANWKQAKGFEDTKKGMLGISWKHNYSDKLKQSTHLFYSNQNTYEARPFNILDEKTIGTGLRTKLSSTTTFFKKQLNWVGGAEFFNDSKKYSTFKNLYQSQPAGNGSFKGENLSNLEENRTYFNIFLDSDYHLSKSTNLTLGLNIHKTFYDLTDSFNTSNTNVSGVYNFNLKVSPSIGITSKLSEASMVFGAISHGFSNPTLEEILLPNTKINESIKPEEGWNFEIGSRGSFLNEKITYAASIFKTEVKNLLVAKRVGEDQYIGANAGKTTYNGLELLLNFDIIKDEFIQLSFLNNISVNDFNFKKYIDFENDYSGNKLTGVPSHTINSSVHFELSNGFYLKTDYSAIGKIPMRDDNTIFSEKYELLNTIAGYKFNVNSKFSGTIYVGINNILNEKYASMLLINATSFGNSQPRYYYPGEPKNYFGGINLSYQL